MWYSLYLIKQATRSTSLAKCAFGVGDYHLDADGNLVIFQGETNEKLGPAAVNQPGDLITRQPWFWRNLPEEYQKQIQFGSEPDFGDRQVYTAEVKIPKDKAVKIEALKNYLTQATANRKRDDLFLQEFGPTGDGVTK